MTSSSVHHVNVTIALRCKAKPLGFGRRQPKVFFWVEYPFNLSPDGESSKI